MKNALSVLVSISLSVFFLSCEKSSDSDLNNLAMDLESKKGGNKKALFIGMEYQGGIIFYLDETGQHGLIAAKENLGPAPWGCYGTSIPIAQRDGIGIGESNTQAILDACNEPGILARLCNDYVVRENGEKGKKYTDWFMPSRHEFHMMVRNVGSANGFCSNSYFASTEISGGFMAGPVFPERQTWDLSVSCAVTDPSIYGIFFMPSSKSNNHMVRPARSF